MICWFPSNTFVIWFVRSHGSGRLRLSQVWQVQSNQSWSPNSGQDMSPRVLLICSFPSKVSIHFRAVSNYLNRISMVAFRCSQPLLWISYRKVWVSTSLLGPTRSRLQHASGQYKPARNNETPLAREDLNSDAIVNAQLTHLVSRDDASQGQDAPHASDVPMLDAPTVHDIATPRRTIGGRCHKLCISAQPPAGKRKCAACSMRGTRFTHGEARPHHLGNRQTNNHCVYAHFVIGDLDMIINFIRKLPITRKQLMLSPASGTPSPGQQRTQKFHSLLLRIRIKPQQLLHLTISGTCLGEKSLSAWMRRSWTSSGSNMLHGTCVAERSSNLPRGSNLRCSRPNMPSFELSFTTTQPLRPQNQPGKRWCSAAGSTWDLQSNASESNCAHYLDTRLELFWAKDCSLGHGTC